MVLGSFRLNQTKILQKIMHFIAYKWSHGRDWVSDMAITSHPLDFWYDCLQNYFLSKFKNPWKIYRTRPWDHILIEENKSGIFECVYADMFSVWSWTWRAQDSKQSANRRNKNNYFQTTDQTSEKVVMLVMVNSRFYYPTLNKWTRVACPGTHYS